MRYQVAPLFCRPWTLNGISARLIESHYEHDYGGAVQRLNAVSDEINALDANGTPPGAIHRLKREELELLNSTLLHELYFASLGGDGRSVPAPMNDALLAISDRRARGAKSSWHWPAVWLDDRGGSF